MEYSDASRISLAALARFFVGKGTLRDTLQQVIELAAQSVPAADMIGITMTGDDGRPTTTVATDDDATAIDQSQYTAGTGPCLDAFNQGEVMKITSIATETRWPKFVLSATEYGIASTLSVPLTIEDKRFGALNLYSRTEAAFDDEDERTATTFAEFAAVPIANAHEYWKSYELATNLNRAMQSRASIEQAKGIIIASQQVGPDEAFEMLRDASQRTNRKVRDLAEDVVSSRRFDNPAEPEPS
jgi:GAF domain-containing protein